MAMYKIFIVEDDEMIAAGLKRHLESWDYKVVCAQDLANIMPEFVYESQCTNNIHYKKAI